MTEMLFMKDVESNYINEFTATVTKSKKDYVILDKTAFYPLGGGQPSDTGTLTLDERKYNVLEVLKKGEILHRLEGELPPEGAEVRGEIDWERRYGHMRMHTAQHIISGVVYELTEARTVGNQIHADRSRVDFAPLKTDDALAKKIEDECNLVISMKLPVKIYEMERKALEHVPEAQRSNLNLLPQSVRRLRIIEIEGFDICPCAGTHVRNTGEIPPIRITKRENKGSGTERLHYTFDR